MMNFTEETGEFILKGSHQMSLSRDQEVTENGSVIKY